jgi:hypothetical protein
MPCRAALIAAAGSALLIPALALGGESDPRLDLELRNRGGKVTATSGSYCLSYDDGNGRMRGVCADVAGPLRTRGVLRVRPGDQLGLVLGAPARRIQVNAYRDGWSEPVRLARAPSADRRRWRFRFSHAAARRCASRLYLFVSPVGGGDVSFEATVRAPGCGPDRVGK